MARRICRLLVFLLPLILLILAAPARAQTGIPPTATVTPTPVPPVPPGDLQDYWIWLNAAWPMYRWWLIGLLALAALALVVRAYGQGWLEHFKTIGQENAKKVLSTERPPALAKNEAEAYLQYVNIAYRRFKFRGTPRAQSEGMRPPELDQAYISLRMTSGKSGRQKEIMGKAAPPELHEDEGNLAGTVLSEPVALADVVKQFPKLAIVGVAGSGKSTLLQWAGLACARACSNEKLTGEQSEFVKALGGKPLFPILIPLRSYNDFCKNKSLMRSPKSLLDFMSDHFSGKVTAFTLAPAFFQKHLLNGCLLMLDGMDEVDPDDRQAVRQAVEDLLAQFNKVHLHCLITSRYSAASISEQMAGFERCAIQFLTPEQRDALISFWYRSVLADNLAEANRKAEDLCSQIKESDERIQKLATTPLMVTIFAMVHNSRDTLPRDRARLYEDAVEVLLSEEYYRDPEVKGLQQWGGMEWETRRDYLACIAFELHERKIESMLENDLVDLIWKAFGSEKEAARKEACAFLRAVAERGGLLEAQNDQFGFFTHATFREYLAGRYLAEKYTPEEQAEFLSARLDNDLWLEPVCLAAGFLAIGGKNQASRFILLLAGLGTTDKEKTQALTLAGTALADLRIGRFLPEVKDRVSNSMSSALMVNPPAVVPRLRYSLGLALGRVGDPRFDPLNPALCKIKAGAYRVGTSVQDKKLFEKQKTKSYPDEEPAHPVTLSEFLIGKYPLTNYEFRAFWEAGGYGRLDGEKPRWWGDDGWQWRIGKWDTTDFSFISDEDLRKRYKEWLARRPVELRDRPFWWDDPQLDIPNLPVVGVCWFEAEAYCKWLSSVTGQHFVLPTEAQWEAAARGAQGNLWPWGNTWDAGKCNNAELEDKIGLPSPVGMYPDGASLCDAVDMAGNVWEWCADWYAEDTYEKRKGLEVLDPPGPETGVRRVVRGGSWSGNCLSARCAYRDWFFPDGYGDLVGFRLVLSPI